MKLYKLETGRDVKLNYNTLIRGARGGRSRAEANTARAWLTDGETGVIIAYIAELGNRGLPLSHRRLREHVNEVSSARLGTKFPEQGVGKQWTHRFIEKYSDAIQMTWSTSLESKPGRAVNPHTAEAWFSLLKQTMT
jgi:Tc5 transposase-like DNA-binding protein